MSKMLEEVEMKIATAIVKSALAAGYSISVDDGEETTVRKSRDENEVLGAMRTVDDDRLYLYKAAPDDVEAFGWVRFVYGNDGWDVVNDYTTNLEPLMVDANAIADHYSK